MNQTQNKTGNTTNATDVFPVIDNLRMLKNLSSNFNSGRNSDNNGHTKIECPFDDQLHIHSLQCSMSVEDCQHNTKLLSNSCLPKEILK